MKGLSIIFQGPVDPANTELYHYLNRTRKAYPESEIILSTWRLSPRDEQTLTAKIFSLGVRLIQSDDPGPLIGKDASGTWYTNLNRLLCSAKAGLDAATCPLAIKLRTDTYLSNRKLLPLLKEIMPPSPELPREPGFLVFQNRVITATWFARDSRGSLPWLFHPGDILLAGNTDDLRLFFSAPLAGPDLFQPVTAPGMWSAWRYVPEQWFWVHAIRAATGNHVFKGNFHHTPRLVAESERYFLANFIPYSPQKLGLHWPKYWHCYPFRGLFSVYTHTRWKRLAMRYQGIPNYSIRALVSWILTGIWRSGFRMRARLLRRPSLRALARQLFSHRKL